MSESEFEKRVRHIVAKGRMVGPDDVAQLLSMVAQERDRVATARAEGYEQARAQAASLAQTALEDAVDRKGLAESMSRSDAYGRAEAQADVLGPLMDDIRAMQPEGEQS